jgi:hypothetical protein
LAHHNVIFEAGLAVSKSRKRKRAPFIIAAIAVVVAGASSGVLASNISLAGGESIEFGQGSQVTSTCDESVSVLPTAWFLSDTNSWGLVVTLTNIDSSACFGKTLTVTSWDNTGEAADEWVFTLDNVESDSGETWMITPGNDAWHYSNDGANFSVSLASTLEADGLGAITVETSN